MIKIMSDAENTWYVAIATKLKVSGMGRTKDEALQSLRRSIRSTNRAKMFGMRS